MYADGADLWTNITSEASKLTRPSDPPLDALHLQSVAVILATDCQTYTGALANATSAYVDMMMKSLSEVTSWSDVRVVMMAIMLLVTLILSPALGVNYVMTAEKVVAAMRQYTTTMKNKIREIDVQKKCTDELLHKVGEAMYAHHTCNSKINSWSCVPQRRRSQYFFFFRLFLSEVAIADSS